MQEETIYIEFEYGNRYGEDGRGKLSSIEKLLSEAETRHEVFYKNEHHEEETISTHHWMRIAVNRDDLEVVVDGASNMQNEHFLKCLEVLEAEVYGIREGGKTPFAVEAETVKVDIGINNLLPYMEGEDVYLEQEVQSTELTKFGAAMIAFNLVVSIGSLATVLYLHGCKKDTPEGPAQQPEAGEHSSSVPRNDSSGLLAKGESRGHVATQAERKGEPSQVSL